MIIEKIHLGKLDDKFHYAEIVVDLLYSEEKEPIKNLRAFIDTGATKTCVNEKVLSPYISLDGLTEIESYSAVGTFKAKDVPNIYISLNPLMSSGQFIPIESVRTCKLDNGFDVIIGNDILFMCEFIYNGISQTYILKLLVQG